MLDMHALSHNHACIKKPIQYTVRNVSDQLQQVVRETATREEKSINSVLLEAIQRGLGYQAEPVAHDDLDALIGSWVEDPETDAALEEFGRVDASDWQ